VLRAGETHGHGVNAQARQLSAAQEAEVRRGLAEWEAQSGTRRLFAGDATLWTGADESRWLGWLEVVETQRARLASLREFREEARRDGFRHALLLGMGGSSLCAEVLGATFGVLAGHPELLVLDSTDPAQVQATEARVELARTLFIVASKSGSTLEPNMFMAHFLDGVRRAVGAPEAGRRFVAITDPGSSLEHEARAAGFRHVFQGVASIGGRYSALSNFGMVPAAAMGLDVERLLDAAARMLAACGPNVAAERNPGVELGMTLGVLAKQGIDKVTFVAAPSMRSLGAWLEQLLAESTGKDGRALIPVDGERLAGPQAYGDDRVFVHLRLDEAPDAATDAAVGALAQAGRPVVRIGVATRRDIAQEFLRWEIATAVAGAVLGVHPFNQPDVEASKVETRKLTREYEERGALPEEAPFFEGQGLRLFADAANGAALARVAGSERSLAAYIRAHLARLGCRDYFAILAYLPMTAAITESLQAMRHRVRDAQRVATCLGFGPRFLHSTGQAYKGGPNRGVFLQLTCDDAHDLPVPGQRYTFGVVKAAQARGDFEVLAERGRRALRVHLGSDVSAGLRALDMAVAQAPS